MMFTLMNGVSFPTIKVDYLRITSWSINSLWHGLTSDFQTRDMNFPYMEEVAVPCMYGLIDNDEYLANYTSFIWVVEEKFREIEHNIITLAQIVLYPAWIKKESISVFELKQLNSKENVYDLRSKDWLWYIINSIQNHGQRKMNIKQYWKN